jgi:hypothetical protein
MYIYIYIYIYIFITFLALTVPAPKMCSGIKCETLCLKRNTKILTLATPTKKCYYIVCVIYSS